jgi:hypothetical protein
VVQQIIQRVADRVVLGRHAHTSGAMLDADVASLSPGWRCWPPEQPRCSTTGRTTPSNALTIPDATRWPFDLAPVHLTYGERR